MTPSIHSLCTHVTLLPTFYGIDLTGLRRLGRLDQVPRSTIYGIDLIGLRWLGRLDQVPRSTMSTIEDSTTFSISMCFNSSTMYFQVHELEHVEKVDFKIRFVLLYSHFSAKRKLYSALKKTHYDRYPDTTKFIIVQLQACPA